MSESDSSDDESLDSQSICSDEDEYDLSQPLEKGISDLDVCIRIFETANQPVFEDVSPMVNSTIPFLIDCDTLMLYAVQQNSHDTRFGNQTLHVVYTCERILDILLQKGATFVLIFVDVWEKAWNRNTSLLALRKIIHQHFTYNTRFRVCRFPSYFSGMFRKFIREEKPRCMLTDLNIDMNVSKFKNNTSIRHAIEIFAGQLVLCLSNDLPMIDVSSLSPKVSIIKSFSLKTYPIHADYTVRFSEITSRMLENRVKPETISCGLLSKNVTRSIILETSKLFFLKIGTKKHIRNLLKLILLTYAAESVPIGKRATPKLKFDQEFLESLQIMIFGWHECLNDVLSYYFNKKSVDVSFEGVSDLWQGTLFATVLYHVSGIIENGEALGSLQNEYESYVNDLNNILDENIIEAYPIYPIYDGKLVEVIETTQGSQELVPLQKISNPLIETFCGDVFDQVLWRPPKKNKNKKFLELRHWHNRKPLTEEYEQIQDSSVKSLQTKWEQRNYMKNAKYLNFYGENLEGRESCYDPIIYQGPNKRNATTQKKQTQKSKDLQKKIIEEKARETLDKETNDLKELKKTLKSAKFGEDPKIVLGVVDKFLSKMTQPETKLKATITKLKTLAKAAKFNDMLSMAKDVFLTIRGVLLNDRERLSEKDLSFLSKVLRQFGFKEIADINNLPPDVKFDELSTYNWVRFQLEHVGSDLLQDVGDRFDPDINFTPDPWQEEFIDAIRKNESALVVAPTSSGKTFACYYCMKRVLQLSDDGIVVYVSPTKALVNQVAATVTNRFKKTTLPDGVALVGVFTRDWRLNALNSRILVTVPQCLDILLMSSQQYKWTKRIKYVIFDEVHRLSGDEEGVVWERLLMMINCPFLALSATISEPNYFHDWLQSIEHAKREMDTLNNCPRNSYNVRFVVHSERHSDLTKYVYLSNQLHHYHPYASLHRVVLQDNQGIPASVTLSSRETLQLYDVLCQYDQAKALLDAETHLEEFFSTRTRKGFIIRSSVTEYAKLLGRVFYGLFQEHEDVYQRILTMFNPPDDNDGMDRRDKMLTNAHALINHMANENMLPAIVFSYNRGIVEAVHSHMVRETMREINDARRKEQERRKSAGIKSKKIIEIIVQEQEPKEIRKARSKTSAILQQAASQFNANGTCMFVPNKFGPRASSDRPPNPLNILRDLKSKFKGVGIADNEDMQFIEERIYRKFHNNPSSRPGDYAVVIKGFQLGIAYHHAGVNKRFRDTTEMLFRMGILKVIIATGTLALGIHMPCKSVVVFGDSPFLNSLEYHQMSGRAGRRGFDNEGNVIFTKLTKKRRDMLITDKLPKMLGNYPISVTLVARLLLLVTNVHEGGKKTEESLNVTVRRALVLLENSLVFKLKPYLKLQIKQFVGFAVQLLLMQKIIDEAGVPLALTVFVHHLHYHEPANLIFSYLIKHGVIREMLDSIDDDALAQYTLVVVLTHLFSNYPLNNRLLESKFSNSKVILEPLPQIVKIALEAYNYEVNVVFNEYFISVARSLLKERGNVPEKLPLSNVEFPSQSCEEISETPGSLSQKLKSTCVPRLVTSPFVALSSNDDTELELEELISNIRHEMSPEVKIVPTFNFDRQLNAYPLDFYRHGIKRAISVDNGLKAGEDFALLKDFYLILKVLVLGLEDLEAKDENDMVLKHMKAVHDHYRHFFYTAYHL